MKTIQKIKVFLVFFTVLSSLMYCKKKGNEPQPIVEPGVVKNSLFIYQVKISEILGEAIVDNVAGTIKVSEGAKEIGLSLDPLENFVLGSADSKMKISDADADEDFLLNAKEVHYIVSNPSDLTVTKKYTLTVDASQAILADKFAVDGVDPKDISIDDENGKIQVMTNKKRKDFVLDKTNLTAKNELSDVNYDPATYTYTISRRGQEKTYIFEAISKDLEVIGFQVENTIGKVDGQKITITEGEDGKVLNIIPNMFVTYPKFENVVSGRLISNVQYLSFQDENNYTLLTGDKANQATHISFEVSMPNGEGGSYSRTYAVIIEVAPDALGLDTTKPFTDKNNTVLVSEVTEDAVSFIVDDVKPSDLVMNPINSNTTSKIENDKLILNLRGTERVYDYAYELYDAKKHAAVNVLVSSKILALNTVPVGQATELPLIYGGHQTNVIRVKKGESLKLADFEAIFEGAKLKSLMQSLTHRGYTLTVDFFGKEEVYNIIPQYDALPLVLVLQETSDKKMVYINQTSKEVILLGEPQDYTEQKVKDLFYTHDHQISVDLNTDTITLTDRADATNIVVYHILYANPSVVKVQNPREIIYQYADRGNIIVAQANYQLTSNDVEVSVNAVPVVKFENGVYQVSAQFENTTIESLPISYTVRELQAEDTALNFVGDKDQILVINGFETTNVKAVLKEGENDIFVKNPTIPIRESDFVQASAYSTYSFVNTKATVTFGTKTVTYTMNATDMSDVLVLELAPGVDPFEVTIDEDKQIVTLFGVSRDKIDANGIRAFFKTTTANDPYKYTVSKRTNTNDPKPDNIRVAFKNNDNTVLGDTSDPSDYNKVYTIIYQPIVSVTVKPTATTKAFVDQTRFTLMLRGQKGDYSEQDLQNLFAYQGFSMSLASDNNSVTFTDLTDASRTFTYSIVYINPTVMMNKNSINYIHNYKDGDDHFVVTVDGRLTTNEVEVEPGFSVVIGAPKKTKNALVHTVIVKYDNTTIESEPFVYSVRTLQTEDTQIRFIGSSDNILIINRYKSSSNIHGANKPVNDIIVSGATVQLQASDFEPRSIHAIYSFSNNIATVNFGTITKTYQMDTKTLAEVLVLNTTNSFVTIIEAPTKFVKIDTQTTLTDDDINGLFTANIEYEHAADQNNDQMVLTYRDAANTLLTGAAYQITYALEVEVNP